LIGGLAAPDWAERSQRKIVAVVQSRFEDEAPPFV